MLGNFSFNDYFKREAIKWSWEFLTEILELPTHRLWVSVHKEDIDSYNIWRDEVGLSESRIVRMGNDDNFWPSGAPERGPVGPGGPYATGLGDHSF